MRLGDVKDVLILAVVGVGAYWLYKKFSQFGKDFPRAASEATYLAFRRAPQVQGKFIVQPSGVLLDPVQYPITWKQSGANQLPTIQYSGGTYIVQAHDADGNFPAVSLTDFAIG
jgi:hypothetical protein